MKTTKSQIFKKLLKEAMREVIKEELPKIIREELRKNGKPIVEAHQDFARDYAPNYYEQFLPKDNTKPKINPTQPTNPIAKILAQTQRTMTTDDIRNMQMGVQMDSAIGVQNGMLAQNLNIGEMDDYSGPSNMPNFPI